MSEWICKLDNGVQVVLDVGPPVLHLDFIWSDMSIIFIVVRQTSMANIAYLQLTTINWHWPFIHTVTNFMDRNMGENEEREEENENSS